MVIDPPSPREDNAPAGIVLIKFPVVVEVTSTETVHEPGVTSCCAGTVPPLKDKVVAPGAAVTTPPQVFATFGGLAMKMPGCTPARLSVQAAFVRSNPLGLKIVTCRREMPPGSMLSGEKLLFISAGKDKSCA